ncbi:transposable element Tc1 transposase [Trichonephila clavipes]|nr:transposable element Tc1 transposase [Trichonephila clavipes]
MDLVILNHGQVTWTIPELAPPLLTTTPHQREDVSALDRFNVHRCPTRQLYNPTAGRRVRNISSAHCLLSLKFCHAWPHRSPDLDPCDYCLYGYLKLKVYDYRPTSLGMLRDNIRRQCLTIPTDMLCSAELNSIP